MGIAARSTELAQLNGVLREIRDTQRGRGRVIILTGEMGVGKTALAEACLDMARATGPAAVTAVARCVEVQSHHRPYGPFRDLIAGAEGVGADPDLLSVVQEAAPAWLPAASAAGSRVALFAQFLDLCQRLAEQRTPVLFIDDLQWSDNSSLDLLGQIGRALAEVPVLILATYEVASEEEQTALRSLRQRLGVNAVELAVRKLERPGILSLAEGFLAGSFGEEFGAWLVGAANGSPLRTELFLRWLRESDALRKRLFRFAVRERDLPDPAVATEDVVLNRFEGLEPGLRWTLEAAALAGTVVDSAVVAGQLGKKEDDVVAGLRLAERHGFLQALRDRRRASGRWSARFRFSHPLYRRLLAERVSGKRRGHLLSRAAESLERLREQQVGEIADEVSALYLNTDAPDRLYEWSLKAADLAERLFALHEVEEYLRLAARTAPSELDRLRIENRLARIYGATGREAEAEALLDAVNKRAGELGDEAVEVSSGTLLAWLRLERGLPLPEIAQLAGRLVDRARATDIQEELVMALDLSCAVAERLGRAEEALLMAEEALHVAQGSSDPELVAQAAYRLARVHTSWGSPESGKDLAQRALEQFSRTGEPGGVVACRDLLATAYFRCGEWDAALHEWEAAAESMQVSGMPDRKAAIQISIGELLTLRGKYEQALGQLNSALKSAAKLEDERLARLCRTGLARLDFERGNYASVLEQTDEIRKSLPESGAWREDFHTTAMRALSYLELGDELQAWQEAARLEQLYQGKEGWFAGRAEGDAVRIRVIDLDSDLWLAGMVAQHGIGETAEDPYGEGYLQYHRACVLARLKPAEAREAVSRAVELFSQLDAAPMLNRARQLGKELETAESEAEDQREGWLTEGGVDQWFEDPQGA